MLRLDDFMSDVKTGLLILNKPVGPTSHDMINKLRRITGIKKIGHAGTLDPFASGVLVVAIGREATREIDKFMKLDKEYIAMLRFGFLSDTFDRMGEITKWPSEVKEIDADEVKKTLQRFIGEQDQLPPMFSAKKINGKKLYELARKGKTVVRQSARINIYNIELLKYKWPTLEIKIKCSSGTYIRALANDIGASLNCGAYLENLKRTSVGSYREEEAISIEKITRDNWSEFFI